MEVSAVNANGEGPKSVAKTATPIGVPAAPTVTLTPSDGQISIAWIDGANNGATITSHKIYVNGALNTTISSASPYPLSGLTNGTAYSVEVAAVNAAGEGPKSAAQNSTPISPARYKFVGGRFRVPSNFRAVSGSNLYHCAQFVFTTGKSECQNPRFFMPSFYQLASGGSAPETAVGNTITIEGVSVKIGSTWIQADPANFPITFDPATSAGVLLPAPIATLPANSAVTARIAYNVPTGASLPTQSRNAAFGDAAQGSTTSLASRLVDGVALTGANTHADGYFPLYCVASTTDTSTVFAIFGDSIGFGANESAAFTSAVSLWSARGAFGYLARGLDDNTTSTRLNFANFCVAGSRPQDITSRDSNWSKKKLDAIKAVYDAYGYYPFDEILHQHGTNSVSGTVTTTQLTGYLRASINALKSDSGKPVTQVEMIAKSASTDGYETLGNITVLAQDAYPSGVRWTTNARIGTDGLPDASTELRADGTIQDSFAPWLYDSYDISSNRDKVKLSDWSTTLAATAAQNASTFSMNAAPSVGDYLNVAYSGGFGDGHVITVSGTGPYTVTMIMTSQIGASGAASGAKVRRQWRAQDGTHPGRNEHASYLQNSVIAWKQRRGWA